MGPHDEVCLCFHVTRRKLENFIRLERPKRAGQLSECFGAGTGCGWCRPFLRKLFEANADASASEGVGSMSTEEYARQRAEYRATQDRTDKSGVSETAGEDEVEDGPDNGG